MGHEPFERRSYAFLLLQLRFLQLNSDPRRDAAPIKRSAGTYGQHKRTMKSPLYIEAERTRAMAYRQRSSAQTASITRGIRVVAEGDSWFSYYPAYDVLACLRGKVWGGRSYEIEGAPRAGSYLNDMVYHPRQLADTFECIRKHRPEAFLFSGGGNDIAGPELFDFLWNKYAGNTAGGTARILNQKVLTGVVDEVFEQAYRDYFGAVQQCAKAAGLPPLPFVCHGYGYAIPDGRGWAGGWGPLPGPWLDPSLSRKNWDLKTDAKIRRAAITDLINTLNAMLARLAAALPGFHYVDVRPVLTDADWGNELHPTEKGFNKVATLIEAKLRQVVP